MMLVRFRLEQHKKKLEQEAIKDIVHYLNIPECKDILDSRDTQSINKLLDMIINEVAKQQKFKKSHTDVAKLGNEVKEDILLLCFTFDYVEKYPDDLNLNFEEIDSSADIYSDYINQFRSFLQAEQLTELNANDYEPGPKGVQNAFKDAIDAWQVGRTTEKMSLGDLFVAERTGPITPSQAMQVQTLPSIDPGFVTGPKGFGGILKKRSNYSPRSVRLYR